MEKIMRSLCLRMLHNEAENILEVTEKEFVHFKSK